MKADTGMCLACGMDCTNPEHDAPPRQLVNILPILQRQAEEIRDSIPTGGVLAASARDLEPTQPRQNPYLHPNDCHCDLHMARRGRMKRL